MAKTLYDYFAGQGQRLPSVEERRKQFGLGSDYVGTQEQNTALLRQLEGGAYKPTTPPASNTQGSVTAAGQPKKVDLTKFYDGESETDKVLQSLINQNRKAADTKIVEGNLRKMTLRQYQQELDAIERIYGDMLNQRLEQEKPAEEARFDALRASQARGGLLGSGRGSGQVAQVEAYNADIRGAIYSEINTKKQTAIQGILNKVREASTKAIEDAREAKRAGADNLIKYLATQQERAEATTNTFIKRLIAEGVDIDDLSPEELAEAAANMKISVGKLQESYADATADSRASMQQVSRENAILAAVRQGITNPADILDILNYDEEGNQIGDITIKEITDTLTNSRGKTTNVSEGTAIVDAFGNVIFKNPKTYKPTGGGSDGFSGGGSTVSIPSYEEWKKTPEAAKVIEDAENQARQNFIPEKREEILRAAYDSAAASARTSSLGTGRLTAEDKQQLTQAGLAGGDTGAQIYFANAEPAFRQYWTRGVATGDFPVGATLDEIDAAHIKWEEEQSGGGDDYDF